MIGGKKIKGITESVGEHGSEGEQTSSRNSGIWEMTGTRVGVMEKVKDIGKGLETTEASGVTSTVGSEMG